MQARSAWLRWSLRLLPVAVGSSLICLSVPPIGLWWLAFVAWAPLTLVAAQAAHARARGERRAVGALALMAMAIAFGRWLWLESWISEVSEAGWPALAALMACYDGVFVWAIARSETLPGVSRCPLAARTAVLLVGCEWLRARVVLDGYPWFMPAQPLVEWPLVAQAADLVGAAGMAVIPGVVAGALADAWLAREGCVASRRARGSLLSAACLSAAALIYGAARLSSAPAEARTLAVLAVQTNVAQSNKDAPDRRMQETQFARLLELSVEGLRTERAAGRRVDVVAWPETVVPGFGFERDAILLQKERGLWPADHYVAPVEALAERSGVPILLGSGSFIGLRVEGDRYAWQRQYNSAYLVRGPGQADRVDKILLTPFGETMPYISGWKWLETRLLAIGANGMAFNLDAGERGRLLQLPCGDGVARVGVPICFEDTVSRAVQSIAGADGGAEALVNLSNDGWFGGYAPGRAQHEQAARWRTIEQRLPLARVANTGTSAGFDAFGRRLAGPLPPLTDGTLRIELPLGPGGSIFSRIGDVASWAMFLASIAMLVRWRPGRAVAVAALATAAGCGGTGSDGRIPSWSSRDQSVVREGDVKLAEGKAPRATLPVSASTDPIRNATQLLDDASRGKDPMIRAIALEALAPDPASLEPAVRRGLADPNPGVRFAAAVVGSKAGLPGLAPLVEPLLMDPNQSVRAGAILALHRAGRKVDPTPLASMVISPDPSTRGNAVTVIGDLGNRTAMPLLRQGFETPLPKAVPAAVRVVDLQIAEAMVKLGDLTQLEPIHAALFSRSDQGECIALGCQIVGGLKDKSSLPMLQRLIDAGGDDTRPLEIRIVAAVACMQIMEPGPEGLQGLGLQGARDARPQVRSVSARLLGYFDSPEAAAALSQLLRDREAPVQVSAAAAILQRGRRAPAEMPQR